MDSELGAHLLRTEWRAHLTDQIQHAWNFAVEQMARYRTRLNQTVPSKSDLYRELLPTINSRRR